MQTHTIVYMMTIQREKEARQLESKYEIELVSQAMNGSEIGDINSVSHQIKILLIDPISVLLSQKIDNSWN